MSDLTAVDEAFIEDAADEMAKAILDDLSDRRDIPRWIGSPSDPDARMVRQQLAGSVIVPELRALLKEFARRLKLRGRT